mmetsp:Transcript_91751/g.165686  ORF Transcript_91751/g.165686 Transcript_91751/m.165686 type:complete len:298 (-) Transcript_91751:27-920(-)
MASHLGILHWQLDTEALEVDHHEEDQEGRQERGDVRSSLAVEGFLQSSKLVAPRDQEVEHGDHRALELRALRGGHRGGTEGLPHNCLADVGGDEEGDARSQAVALLQQLVQEQHHDPCEEELHDDEDGVAGAQVLHLPVHAAEHVGHGLSHGDGHAEELLGPGEERAVLLQGLVDVDELGARQQLHDHAGGHNGGDAKLHERATVGGEDDPHPVEGVRRLVLGNAVQGDLAAHQEDEEGDASPQDLLAERDPPLGGGHFREDAHHWLHEVYHAELPHGAFIRDLEIQPTTPLSCSPL